MAPKSSTIVIYGTSSDEDESMPERPFPDPVALSLALRRSANRMRRIHAALGLPIVTGTLDRVIHLDPVTHEEIPPDQLDAYFERAPRLLDD
jgi:hypothetical protein